MQATTLFSFSTLYYFQCFFYISTYFVYISILITKSQPLKNDPLSEKSVLLFAISTPILAF